MESAEMYPFNSTRELLQIATKVESHLRSKASSRYASRVSDQPLVSKSWEPEKAKGIQIREPVVEQRRKYESANVKVDPIADRKKSVVCFYCKEKGHYSNACPNKRITVIQEERNKDKEKECADDAESDSGSEEYEEENRESGSSEGEINLLAMRNLNASATTVSEKQGRVHDQRENLFYCLSSLGAWNAATIVDNGSCTNTISKYAVDQLGLTTHAHPKPYNLKWMTDSGNLKVTKQARVSLTIGGFADEVLCDIVPMNACHLILGRPWMSDRGIKYDGKLNMIKFRDGEKKVVIRAMSPKRVRKTQAKLLEKMRENGKDKEKQISVLVAGSSKSERKKRQKEVRKGMGLIAQKSPITNLNSTRIPISANQRKSAKTCRLMDQPLEGGGNDVDFESQSSSWKRDQGARDLNKCSKAPARGNKGENKGISLTPMQIREKRSSRKLISGQVADRRDQLFNTRGHIREQPNPRRHCSERRVSRFNNRVACERGGFTRKCERGKSTNKAKANSLTSRREDDKRTPMPRISAESPDQRPQMFCPPISQDSLKVANSTRTASMYPRTPRKEGNNRARITEAKSRTQGQRKDQRVQHRRNHCHQSTRLPSANTPASMHMPFARDLCPSHTRCGYPRNPYTRESHFPESASPVRSPSEQNQRVRAPQLPGPANYT